MSTITVRKAAFIGMIVLLLAGCAAGPVGSAAAPAANTTSSSQAAAPAYQSKIDLEQAYIKLYANVNPSVVHIRVVEKATATDTTLQINPTNPLQPNQPNQQQAVPQQGVGSGFVYDTDGHIVTNNHVVDGAQKVVVTFYDGTEASATVVGTDPASDLAVVKVDVSKSMLQPVKLGNSDSLQVGQFVVAIGNPFDLQNSMSTGIVSGLGRMLPLDSASTTGTYNIPDMVQTDAAINPGNSGGPLLDMNGEVVGVNTAIESGVRQSSGVSYAVPVDLVKIVVPDLISKGKVEHPWLGMAGNTISSDQATAMKLDANTRGVLVNSVTTGGPSDKAGIKGGNSKATIDGIDTTIGGDVILGINDKTVKIFDDLLAYIFTHTRPGDVVTLHILRDGKPMDVKVTMGVRPNS
jgi:serine protease Do